MNPSPPIKRPQPQSANPRRIVVPLLLGLAVLGLLTTQYDTIRGLLMAQGGAIREHQRYFTENRQDVVLPFAELSEAWTERTLREKFAGYPIQCYRNPGRSLGDLGCAMDTKSFNGIPALFISFFFTSGHLRQISISIPWWEHQATYKYLTTALGPPTASQLFPYAGIRLHGWLLADGTAVFYNRDKSLNPLQWNAINWRSASSCMRTACFTP